MNEMSRHIKFLIAVFSLTILSGCMKTPNEAEVRKWVQKISQPCGGQVSEFTLIRESLLSNKFVGYAKVDVRGESYYPDLVVYVDDKNSFYKMEQNTCALADILD